MSGNGRIQPLEYDYERDGWYERNTGRYIHYVQYKHVDTRYGLLYDYLTLSDHDLSDDEIGRSVTAHRKIPEGSIIIKRHVSLQIQDGSWEVYMRGFVANRIQHVKLGSSGSGKSTVMYAYLQRLIEKERENEFRPFSSLVNR